MVGVGRWSGNPGKMKKTQYSGKAYLPLIQVASEVRHTRLLTLILLPTSYVSLGQLFKMSVGSFKKIKLIVTTLCYHIEEYVVVFNCIE